MKYIKTANYLAEYPSIEMNAELWSQVEGNDVLENLFNQCETGFDGVIENESALLLIDKISKFRDAEGRDYIDGATGEVSDGVYTGYSSEAV